MPRDCGGSLFAGSPSLNRSSMIRYITSAGENPWKRPVRLSGGRISKGAWAMVKDDGFSPVLINSVRGPGFAFGAIATSTNKYVPLSLAFGAPKIRQPRPTALTLAFRRFFPRISKRTGLTELPTHQLGGSTLRTSGVVCEKAEKTPPSKTMRTKNPRATGIRVGEANG